ncbi:MAG: peptide-methionine (S)-S-oxide reductase MsrA [Rhodospirillales bacterium]|jgi:peptide-methionine (S)-S-oxide reductase
MEKATFAAGCFWGVEHTFRQVPGVTKTQVGYIGGTTDNPTYEEVCSKTTGHAEAVELEYDPDQVTYTKLLGIFWGLHDPTTKDRQGPDIGTQYRSAIFPHNDAQKKQAEVALKALDESGQFRDPIVTQIEPTARFWPAEEYHQQYFEKMGRR